MATTTPETISSLTAMLVRGAARDPDGVALIYNDRGITFAELLERSRRVASGLRAVGIREGDRVAIWLPNTPAYLIATFACAHLNAAAVAVNTRFRSAEVEDILARSGARALVYWPDFRGIDFTGILADVHPSSRESLLLKVEYREEDGASAPSARGATVAFSDLERTPITVSGDGHPDSACKLFTTSGTTSRPKLVVHTQRSIAVHAAEVARSFGLYADATLSAVYLPLSGVFGFCGAMASLAAGRPTLLAPGFDAASMVRDLQRHRVTHFNATDDMVHRLLEQGPSDSTLARLSMVGFAAFNSALGDIVERADNRGLTLVGLWGMSEMQALVARRDVAADAEERAKGGGRLVSEHANARVRDPQSGKLAEPGEAGELEIRGPSRMLEYLDDPDATRSALTGDGYVRTGDLALMESSQAFCYLTRMGDVMRLGGYLVSPSEIEAALQALPPVAQTQVVSAPTDLGERAVAFVIPAAGQHFDEADIAAQCAQRMAAFKVPCRIIALDAFPVAESANGTKIQRSRLREMARQIVGESC